MHLLAPQSIVTFNDFRRGVTLAVYTFVFIFLIISFPSDSAGFNKGLNIPEKEHVILLHGITSKSLNMFALENYLYDMGYDVINISYPSTQYRIEQLIEIVSKMVEKKLEGTYTPVHFVGHSMGGLIIRGILKYHRPKQLGHVVMLGTPNHGSELADLLKDFKPFQTVFGPAGQQLTTKNKEVEQLLGLPDYPCGIIAGTAPPGVALLGSIIVPGGDDSVVSAKSATLNNACEVTILEGVQHTLLPVSPEALRLTANFLKDGTFKSAPNAPALPAIVAPLTP